MSTNHLKHIWYCPIVYQRERTKYIISKQAWANDLYYCYEHIHLIGHILGTSLIRIKIIGEYLCHVCCYFSLNNIKNIYDLVLGALGPYIGNGNFLELRRNVKPTKTKKKTKPHKMGHFLNKTWVKMLL